MSTTPRDAKGGFVLIAVLAVMALLSTVVVVTSFAARNAFEAAAIQDQQLASDSMAMAAVEIAGYQLFVLRHPVYRIDGETLHFNAGSVRFNVSSASGKVDLNGASAELLAAAYRASGLRSMDPDTFAARVVDWRDGDDETTPNGAEYADYASNGLAFRPRNGAFRAVGDLAWVMGLSPEDVAGLAQYVTIFHPRGLLDVASVSPALLTALPGADARSVAAVVQLRQLHPEDTTGSIELLAGHARLLDAEVPRSYMVRMELRPTRGRSRNVQLVMIESVSQGSPYQIVSWEEP